MYNHLANGGIDRSFKHLWKAKIPLKIKIWFWLIWHNAIPSKDNMKRRKWNGDTLCRFCDQEESIGHLFFSCPAAKYVWSVVARSVGANTRSGSFSQYFQWIIRFLAMSRNIQITTIAAICWAIWKLINRACFEHKLIKSPVDLVMHACVFMKHWAGLHDAEEGEMLREGADMLQRNALGDTKDMDRARVPLLGLPSISRKRPRSPSDEREKE